MDGRRRNAASSKPNTPLCAAVGLLQKLSHLVSLRGDGRKMCTDCMQLITQKKVPVRTSYHTYCLQSNSNNKKPPTRPCRSLACLAGPFCFGLIILFSEPLLPVWAVLSLCFPLFPVLGCPPSYTVIESFEG